MARFSEEDIKTIWDMREAGAPVKRIAKHLGRQNSSLRQFIADASRRRPSARERSEKHLSLVDREDISRTDLSESAEGLMRGPRTWCSSRC
jgi:transposase-like protein